MIIPFIKCHGSGNDFIMIHQKDLQGIQQEGRFAKLVCELCDRSGPIGSDGILIIAPSEKYDGTMIMYNVDGTEAEMCGNGMRCVARELIEHTGKSEIFVGSHLGYVHCQKLGEMSPGVYTTSIDVGPVHLEASAVPIQAGTPEVKEQIIPELDPRARFTALSIPNPHLITFVDRIDRQLLQAWGKRVTELPEIFPQGINISMVEKTGNQSLFVQTYERGCGMTQACGTAISSSSFVSCLLGHCQYDHPIDIQTEGGLSQCLVSLEQPKHVQLSGNASYLFQGNIEVEEGTFQIKNVETTNIFEDEEKAYTHLLEKIRKP